MKIYEDTKGRYIKVRETKFRSFEKYGRYFKVLLKNGYIILLFKEKEFKRCKCCKKPLRAYNLSGYCANCQKSNYWKIQYDYLKAEFERYKELIDITIKSFLKELEQFKDKEYELIG